MYYEVIKDRRWFKPGTLYSQVQWTELDAIVDAFSDRLSEWYLKPAEALKASGHFAFAAMALNCILIDTLSQYHAGALASSSRTFKAFVRQAIPEFAEALPAPIEHFDATKNKKVMLADFADVLYHAYRCGIVHEAHITPYGMILGGQPIVQCKTSGFTKYASAGSNCPSVVIEPWVMLERIKDVLVKYIQELKTRDPRFDDLRGRFKRKFSESFGVDITCASSLCAIQTQVACRHAPNNCLFIMGDADDC